MKETISLIKIDSANQDRSIRLTLGSLTQDEIDLITLYEESGYYKDAAVSPFGMFTIKHNDSVVGGITLTTSRAKNFDSSGLVSIEISYSILEEHRGKGIMVEAVKLAVQHIQDIKESHAAITFIECNHCDKPEEREVFTAQSVGIVWAGVSSISNYPSLSSSIKAGGEIAELSSGPIKVTFLNPDAIYFSKAFTLQVMQCSKTLCQLGFNEFECGDIFELRSSMSVEQKTGAWEAIKILFDGAEDPKTQDVIRNLAQDLVPEFAEELAERSVESAIADDTEFMATIFNESLVASRVAEFAADEIKFAGQNGCVSEHAEVSDS